MSADHVQVWQNCLAKIKEGVNAQSFSTWFEPIRPLRLDGSVLTIQVPNKFFYEWLEEHYVVILKEAIQVEIGADAQLEYLIPKKTNIPRTPSFKKENLDSNSNRGGLKGGKIKNPFVIPGIQKLKIDSQLNPNYTFEHFIEGDCCYS